MSIISIKNVEKTYHVKNNDITAIKDISLDVEAGEIYGVIGLSGAGKSTLIRCINMLEKPTAGEVFFDGQDLGKLPRKKLLKARQQIGMIFQNFNLLEQRTVLNNICYPMEIAKVPRKEAVQRARELLEIVDLADREKAYPGQLSGGQKQRVAIARALANNPKVLLCDEATSALDPKTTESILQLLKEINEKMGVTIFVITHEMSVIEKICSKVAVIDQSHIVEVGEVKEIFLNPRSDMAKQLIIRRPQEIQYKMGERHVRIVFDGKSSYEPVIANLALNCRAAVNIMYADTRDIDGKAFGEMVISLPEDEATAERVLAYLDSINIKYSEEVFNGQ